MRIPPPLRAACALWIVGGAAVRSARALVTLNDGTDKIYVSGTWTMGYDSNLSASAGGSGDVSYGGSAAIEYQRRAGIIGVTSSVTFTLTDYLKSQDRTYNSLNPTFSLELDKQSGRTTGAVTFSATRSSQADAAAGVHDVSWDYTTGLNLHYPVIERYSLTGSVSYGQLDYTQTSGQALVNLDTYTADVGLFYVLSDARDLSISYRYRDEASTDNTSTVDNALLFGVYDQLFGQIHGSLVVGLQRRAGPSEETAGVTSSGDYDDITATATAIWNLTRQNVLTGTLSRDFTTTSTNATTDTTEATLDLTRAFNAKLSANVGVGGGENQFLGPFGFLPDTTIERRDYYFTWNAGVNYIWSDHLKVSLAYTYLRNWSNLAFATFDRGTYTVTLASRW
jgi:hypothetical protein